MSEPLEKHVAMKPEEIGMGFFTKCESLDDIGKIYEAVPTHSATLCGKIVLTLLGITADLDAVTCTACRIEVRSDAVRRLGG